MASVPNPVTISRANPLLFKFAGYSVKPISRFVNQTKIPPHLFQTSGFRSLSSSFYSQLFPCSRWALFKDIGCAGTGYSLLGSDHFRVSADSGGGSGGCGDSGCGNCGGQGEGGDEEEEDDGGALSNRSLLTWCMFLVEKYFVLKKAVTSVVNLIGDLIYQVQIPLNMIVHLSIVLVGFMFFCVILLALMLPSTFRWFF